MKLVVTGAGADGRSTVLHAQEIEDSAGNVAPGMVYWPIGGVDGIPSVPFTAVPTHSGGTYPPPGSMRIGITKFLGDGSQETVANSGGNDVADILDEDGNHETNSVDIGWVITGEVGIRLTDGSVTWLQQGDAVVIGGVEHAWVGKPGVDALSGWVLFGGARSRPA